MKAAEAHFDIARPCAQTAEPTDDAGGDVVGPQPVGNLAPEPGLPLRVVPRFPTSKKVRSVNDVPVEDRSKARGETEHAIGVGVRPEIGFELGWRRVQQEIGDRPLQARRVIGLRLFRRPEVERLQGSLDG